MHDLGELQALLEAACTDAILPGPLRFKAMFGGVTGYAGERPFASLSEIGLALKLSKADREVLARQGGKALQYESDQTPSKSAIVVPEQILCDPDALRTWALRSARHVQSLAAPKPRRSR